MAWQEPCHTQWASSTQSRHFTRREHAPLLRIVAWPDAAGWAAPAGGNFPVGRRSHVSSNFSARVVTDTALFFHRCSQNTSQPPDRTTRDEPSKRLNRTIWARASNVAAREPTRRIPVARPRTEHGVPPRGLLPSSREHRRHLRVGHGRRAHAPPMRIVVAAAAADGGRRLRARFAKEHGRRLDPAAEHAVRMAARGRREEGVSPGARASVARRRGLNRHRVRGCATAGLGAAAAAGA